MPPSVKRMEPVPKAQASKAKLTKAQIAARVREAGERAAAEAETRRQAAQTAQMPPEQGGPKGPEPTRYGDWERKGIISDF